MNTNNNETSFFFSDAVVVSNPLSPQDTSRQGDQSTDTKQSLTAVDSDNNLVRLITPAENKVETMRVDQNIDTGSSTSQNSKNGSKEQLASRSDAAGTGGAAVEREVSGSSGQVTVPARLQLTLDGKAMEQVDAGFNVDDAATFSSSSTLESRSLGFSASGYELITVKVTEPGSCKRVGGIGDVLSGVVALFCSWQHISAGDANGKIFYCFWYLFLLSWI